jgi:hypothetical protein
MRGCGRGDGRVAITARSLEVRVLDASFTKAQMTANLTFELLESLLLGPSRPLLDQVKLWMVRITNSRRITEIDGGSV